MIEDFAFPVVKLWLSMALITFAIVCYTDLKKREVDSRRNSLMLGAGLMATIPIGLGFMYLVITFITMAFNKIFDTLNKRRGLKYFAKGDQSILLWVLPSLILLGSAAPWTFLLIMIALLIGISIIQQRFNQPFGKLIPGALIMAVALLITIGIFV